jgi:type I restriction enzyme, S subunit
MWSEGTGSTVSNVRIPVLKALKIPRLGQSERGVAAVLGALDDKIELNRRMNATLEGMAQAIFRDWFVDFGPTRRKLAGITDPALILGGLTASAALAALFPAALGDNGLPEGWCRRPLSECADVLSGSTPSKASALFWSGSIPWISPKLMTSIHVEDSDDHLSVEAVQNGAKLVPSGTTLVMVRGMGLHAWDARFAGPP